MSAFTRDIFNFRLLNEGDFVLLHKWLNTPHVAENWDGQCSIEDVKKKYKRKLTSILEACFIVEISGKPVAYVSYYKAGHAGNGEFPKEPAGTLGIDLFIAIPELLRKGLGPRIIIGFTDWLNKEFAPSKILADPKPENKYSIRAFEKAGFVQRGVEKTSAGEVVLLEKK